jgi:transcriptional regulator with XRE-family HTH domain
MGVTALGITETDLAKRVGMSRTYLYRVLGGGRPGTKHLAKIAQELGSTVTWLTTGQGAAPSWCSGSPTNQVSLTVPPLSQAIAHLDAASRLVSLEDQRLPFGDVKAAIQLIEVAKTAVSRLG